VVGHTVVIADDDSDVVSAMSQLLETAGDTVVGRAVNGEEAMWLCQSLRPDVLLLDIQMPGVNGLEAAKRIMAFSPVPIVICSAYYNDKLINAAGKIGVCAYVIKPCRLEQLLSAINLAISHFHENNTLKGEVDALRETLENRKLIEQAKGIIMETRGISEDAAHMFLQQESQRQSRSLPELAKAIALAYKSLSPRVYGEGNSSRRGVKVKDPV